jgi:hypothetical protein
MLGIFTIMLLVETISIKKIPKWIRWIVTPKKFL